MKHTRKETTMKTLMTSLILTNAAAVATAIMFGGLWMLVVPVAAGITVGLIALESGDE